MATCSATPNVQRFALPEIEFDRDNNGIIAVIDDLVERVMASHYRRVRLLAMEEAAFEQELDSQVLANELVA